MTAQRRRDAGLAALTGLLLLLAAGAAESSAPKAAPAAQRAAGIYANGSFLGTWHDTSMGCLRCNPADAAGRRNGSTASFAAAVAPWGALTFTSSEAHSTASVLDFWARGSGITALSLFVKDAATNTASRDVRFTRADLLSDQTVTVLGSDDDGWIHFQVQLASLRAAAAAGNASAAPPPPACAAGALTFDRLVLADVSGMGFNLALDDVKLLSPDLFAASAFTIPGLATPRLAPVFGTDLTSLKAASNRFLVRFKDTAAVGDVTQICQELAGKLQQPRRFSGLCHTPLATLGNLAAPSSRLSWQLATLTVSSAADLQAMRRALTDKVDYFEADLTAFTTTRALRQAVLGGGRSSGEGSVASPAAATNASGGDAATAAAVDRPDWALPPGEEPKTSNGRPSWAQPVDAPAGAAGAPWPSPAGRVTPVPSPSPAPAAGGSVAQLPSVQPGGAGKDDVAHTQPWTDDVGASEQTASAQGTISWGLDRINQYSLPLDGYFSSGDYDGRGVHVYVLDTGVRATHYDFRGRVGDGASAVGTSIADDNGHGTHVAATVLGSIHGVARSAILHPVKVLGADGSGAYSNIIAGMQWVRDHKARNGIASAVISMSLAGPRSAALNDAVEAAAAAGITVVTAAGNNKGGDSCTMSPCSAPSAITVGASTDADAMAAFSNVGACLSVFAPGAVITSASYTSDTAEAAMSGTSMAAPHVSGVAALYLQYRPGARASEVKAALRGAAVPKFFEASSPQALLNAISARLRAAGPATTVKPSPSPKPAAPPSPSPKPPTSTTPTTTTPTLSVPSYSLGGSFCTSCPWCMWC